MKQPPASLRRCSAYLGLGVPIWLASPAAAELQVQVSRAVTGKYESVGITVTDPLSGLDVKPGPLLLTMADSGDKRQSYSLEPTGRPGEWYGRFTPTREGRYTGTVILDRENQKDIGLVPLIRVQPSSRPGFVRLHPNSQRVLAFSSGATLFPLGVKLASIAVADVDWKEQLPILRARGINYLAVSVPCLAQASVQEKLAVTRSLDTLLLNAELNGRPLVQIRFDPPVLGSAEAASAYEEQVRECVRRWSYSPALATWEIPGPEEGVTLELQSRLVDAVRRSDSYNHLIAVRSVDGTLPPGAHLTLTATNWQRPALRKGLMETREPEPSLPVLPGEASWQMLVLGGLGLPLVRYVPGTPEGQAALSQLSRLGSVARNTPYHAQAVPLTDVVPLDVPGSFCRYGSVLVGWTAPETAGPFKLPSMPRGRYRVGILDPETHAEISEQHIWSDGAGAEIELPPNLRTVFLQVSPASAVSRTTRSGGKSPVRKRATRKSTAKRVTPKKAAPKRVAAGAKPARKKVRKTASSRISTQSAQARYASRSKRGARKSTPARARKSSVRSRKTSRRRSRR